MSSSPVNWPRFLAMLLGCFLGGLIGLAAFVGLMNPFGNLPHFLLREHVIMDEHQRFQYPSVIRSHRFDSAVIGTSTARLLEPSELERILPGRFAQLSMNSATPWEQTEVAKLFVRHTKKPRTLIVGLDGAWCDGQADVNRITHRGFPTWMYDENIWNDLPYMLNGRTVEIAARRFGYMLGVGRAPLGPNGYGVFVPAETKYDLAKARKKIWKEAGPHPIVAVAPAFVASEAQKAAWRFPALPWLEEILGQGWQQIVLIQMPTHVAAQPVPGSQVAAMDAVCRARIAAIAERAGAQLIDFRIVSPLTTRDENYWDALHYRVPVASRIVSEIGRALSTRAGDPNGDWRYVAGPGSKAAPLVTREGLP